MENGDPDQFLTIIVIDAVAFHFAIGRRLPHRNQARVAWTSD